MLEKRLGSSEEQKAAELPKKEAKSNGLALPTPVKKKVVGALDLFAGAESAASRSPAMKQHGWAQSVSCVAQICVKFTAA